MIRFYEDLDGIYMYGGVEVSDIITWLTYNKFAGSTQNNYGKRYIGEDEIIFDIVRNECEIIENTNEFDSSTTIILKTKNLVIYVITFEETIDLSIFPADFKMENKYFDRGDMVYFDRLYANEVNKFFNDSKTKRVDVNINTPIPNIKNDTYINAIPNIFYKSNSIANLYVNYNEAMYEHNED